MPSLDGTRVLVARLQPTRTPPRTLHLSMRSQDPARDQPSTQKGRSELMWKPLDPDTIGHGQRCDTFTIETTQLVDAGYIPLRCDNCAATWVGPNREPCPWCEERVT